MAAFAFKAMTLSLKTLAKPLSERFKSYVLDHPTFRGRVIELAQVKPHMKQKVRRTQAASGSADGWIFLEWWAETSPL